LLLDALRQFSGSCRDFIGFQIRGNFLGYVKNFCFFHRSRGVYNRPQKYTIFCGYSTNRLSFVRLISTFADSSVKVLSTASEIGQQVHNAKSTGKIVGLVPTMGALHQGHVSLVTQARRECDLVVVSIFVNPTQFNDPQDFSTYPRDLTTDVQILKQAGCDIAFTPGYDEVYPTPDDRQYFFGDLETRFEGAHRPGHFRG